MNNSQRKLQFEIIAKVREKICSWAMENNIEIHNIEVVVPFVDTDFDLHVVFFFNTSNQEEEYGKKNFSSKIKEEYLRQLKLNGYPEEWLNQVTFEFDSFENVEKNFEGSYFNRMR